MRSRRDRTRHIGASARRGGYVPRTGGWDFNLSLVHDGPVPLFLQVVRAITADIRRGRLRSGDPLPSTRSLAAMLGIHRNTALAAYEELAAEGWITASRSRGTFVSAELPERALRRFSPAAGQRRQVPNAVGFEVGHALSPLAPFQVQATPPDTLLLAADTPDVRLIPLSTLGQAYRRVLRTHRVDLLNYGSPRGHPRLRAALAAMLSTTRGLVCDASDVQITRGSQMALSLVALTLVQPGDVVVVEELGFRAAWEAFRLAGARLVAAPIDAEGLRTDALRDLLQRERIRAVYVTPHHQHPTTVTMTARRRVDLLELARRYRFAIIEDDYDHEFHYDGRPVLPLASADDDGQVIYIGTLSKVLAPGIRIGYVVAPSPLLDRIARYRSVIDGQGDHTLEAAVAILLEEGEVQRHVRRTRRVYQSRRDALLYAIQRRLKGVLACDAPAGGMAVWARVADDAIDAEAWASRAEARGVLLHTAQRFAFDQRARPFFRLGFSYLDERELSEAVVRMAAALA